MWPWWGVVRNAPEAYVTVKQERVYIKEDLQQEREVC